MTVARKNIALISIALVITALILVLSINANTASGTSILGIETYDNSGNIRTDSFGDNIGFNVGEYVYISWVQQNDTFPVDVSATGPNGNALTIYKVSTPLSTPALDTTPQSANWTNQYNSSKQCLAFFTTTLGNYQIIVDSASGATKSLTVSVVSSSFWPPTSLGAILATGAGFVGIAMLALIGVVKVRARATQKKY